MPGVAVDGVNEDVGSEGNVTLSKHNSAQNIRSPKSTLSPQSPRSVNDDDADVTLNEALDTSIEHLYDNVCEMQSSDQSPSRRSFSSDDDNESRIDWELRHLVGGEMREVEIMEEEVANEEEKEEGDCSEFEIREDGFGGQKSGSKTQSKKSSDECTKPSLEKISPFVKDKKGKILRKKTPLVRKRRNLPLVGSDSGLDNPDLGPFLLEKARDMISSGDNLNKALDFALQASKSFEICADGNEKCSLELIMSLHVTAAVYCSLGRYNEAIPVLKRSIELPSIEDGENYALAKFAGNMQLGDTFAMLGQLGNSIECYTDGLNIQREVLGEKDIRVGETCRYLAEVHVQAMQFDEAEKVCEMALNIHRESGSPGSLEEAADRRLMGLIYETKGDHEKALEHLVLASMAMVANGQEKEVVSVDCSIGDTYLSLSRYDEAIFAYEKALANFKSSKGENHPAVASVFVRLADLYNKTGNLRESKSYCENALRIYGKPVPGISQEDIASGFTDVSAIYESMNELDQAIKLLQKALKIYNNAPGQQNTIAGIEAQLGCMFYVLGNYTESYNSFKSAVTKMRASGEKKSAFFGLGLNQMGLCCVQRYAINEATDLFEEAKSIMEKEHGQYHPDTLGVYSNLAGTYDAMGRLDDAIQLLEYVVGMREEKLGTANPDVDDEKRRLAELLKEAGKVRSRKATSLGNLFGGNS